MIILIIKIFIKQHIYSNYFKINQKLSPADVAGGRVQPHPHGNRRRWGCQAGPDWFHTHPNNHPQVPWQPPRKPWLPGSQGGAACQRQGNVRREFCLL